MEDKEFPTLEEWGKSPVIKFVEFEERVARGWAVTILEMSEIDRLTVLNHIAKTAPLIHQRVQKILNKGETK